MNKNFIFNEENYIKIKHLNYLEKGQILTALFENESYFLNEKLSLILNFLKIDLEILEKKNKELSQKRSEAAKIRWQKVKAEKAGAIQKAESKPATLEENHQQIKADDKELSFKDYKNKFLKPQKVTNLKGGLTI